MTMTVSPPASSAEMKPAGSDKPEEVHAVFDTILILDFGIIFSGGPYSVYAPDAPHADPAVFELGVPILGICYGMQELGWTFGKGVAAGDRREYGHAVLHLEKSAEEELHTNRLFSEIPPEFKIWMSHGDKLSALPTGFHAIASTENAPFAAIAHASKPWYGIQFHPEVTHTAHGQQIIKNFAVNICGSQQHWTMGSFVDTEVARIRNTVGPKAQVIGAVSGGVDSTVAAKLLHRAIGSRFHAVLVDNGLMRLNECEAVRETLTKHLGINLTVVDASELFLERLDGVEDPEKKRKIIGNTFIEVFEREGDKIDEQNAGKIEFLLQGTLYPDVIESISFKGPSATIKTHHNVGGLLEDMKLKLIEPLRELFKDEVRELGKLMGINEDLVWRHPFPGPGLAIRVLGPVYREQLAIARQADHIFITEIRKAGLYNEISQAFAVLLPVKAVGVMGDQRTYEQVIVLRAMTTTDFMTAEIYNFDMHFLSRVSSRIVNEVKGVNRVTYDLTGKPPGTIEWL